MRLLNQFRQEPSPAHSPFPLNKQTPNNPNMKKLPKIAKSHIAGISFAVAMASMPCLLQAQSAGENLLKNGGAESGDSGGWIEFPSVSTNAKEGSNAFVCKPGAMVRSEELIPINSELRYKLSGFFKSEGEEVKLCLGFVSYDADEKEIQSSNITPITGTETKLSEAASKGDKVLKIENGQQWVFDTKWTPDFGYVAFDVDDSGAYSDLPNRNLSAAGLKSIRQVGGQWEVELAKPLTADFVAGTKVRQHRAQGACLWIDTQQVGSGWKELKGRIAGVSEGVREHGKFWPGTKFVKVAILIETPNFKGSVLVDELVFSQVE